MTSFKQVWHAKWPMIVGLFLFVWAIESFSYFVVATWAGGVHGGVASAVNLQLGIDRVIPWFTPIFALYMPLPFIWIILWPVMAWFAGRERLFWQYFTVSSLVYVISTVIYAVMPTVTIPHDFLVGPIQVLSKDSAFYSQIAVLDSSSVNVFGSFPSYHNTWAALAVFFGVVAHREHRSVLGVICVVFGLLITLSTFLLHQHAVLDAVFTYALVGLCWWLDAKLGWSRKLLQAKK